MNPIELWKQVLKQSNKGQLLKNMCSIRVLVPAAIMSCLIALPFNLLVHVPILNWLAIGLVAMFIWPLFASMDILYCEHCKKRVKLGASSCHHCGRSMETMLDRVQVPPQVSLPNHAQSGLLNSWLDTVVTQLRERGYAEDERNTGQHLEGEA